MKKYYFYVVYQWHKENGSWGTGSVGLSYNKKDFNPWEVRKYLRETQEFEDLIILNYFSITKKVYETQL